MAQEANNANPKKLRFECGSHSSVTALVSYLAETIAHTLSCDQVLVTLLVDGEAHSGQFPPRGNQDADTDGPIFNISGNAAFFNGRTWHLPLVINDLQRARVPSELALELAVRKVRSAGIFPLTVNGRLEGVVECFFTRSYHRWSQDEFDAFIALEKSQALTTLNMRQEKGEVAAFSEDDLRSQYRRMARYGNIIVIITDAEFQISDVFGDTEQLLGVRAAEMLRNADIWNQVITPRDRARIRRRIKHIRIERGELREEVCVIHQRSGEQRWMMLRAVPNVSSQGIFLGWEGFGIDITERRVAQEALISQNRRLEALIEVSHSLRGQLDPAVVTLKGLRAVLRATNSHCGYGCFIQPEGGELELVATQGLSEKYIDAMEPVLKGPSILRHVVERAQGLTIEDLQEDPRAYLPLAKLENLHSTIVVPLMAEGQVFGALVLFKREAGAYTDMDYELVQAAAAQITLAVRQAEMFASERRHSESLSALYRLSHELSKYRSAREIAENTFPLLQQEFGLKRAWFGAMNEQGTHIVGQGGFGPGIKRQLRQVQIELAVQHDFLDEALRTQRPVLVHAGQQMKCSEFNSLMQRLRCDLLAIIPLVSLGQIVGVLIVEPSAPNLFIKDGRLQLLVSMANEMATVLMARRFESKMADSLKMRMAGLLASGVAHNFNNLLQAILGQVSLIEIQAAKGEAVGEFTKMITDAAKRGSTLVSQLLNFSTQAPPLKQNISLNSLVLESTQLYESLLGKKNGLRIEPYPECPDIVGDPSQLQQVITALIANAKDAMRPEIRGIVTVSMIKVRLRSGEIEPEMAPGMYLRLDIKDNGVGMTVEQQTRCFEPFYTTKNVDRGTGVGLSGSGLGLSAAYSIVKQHDGLITVHSKPGEGTTFSVYLPILSVKVGSNLGSDAQQQRSSASSGVLLLGVESGVQPFFNAVFESLGYRSRGAFDAVQILEILKQDSARWGFVVLDLDNLGEGAVKLATQLLNDFSELAILGVGSPAREWIERMPASQRIEVVDKPVGVWTIESALQRLRARPEEYD